MSYQVAHSSGAGHLQPPWALPSMALLASSELRGIGERTMQRFASWLLLIAGLGMGVTIATRAATASGEGGNCYGCARYGPGSPPVPISHDC